MRSKLILVLVGLCVLHLNNVSAATTDNQTMVINKINQVFPEYLKSILSAGEISGFKSTDILDDATLSKPFQIYVFDTTSVKQFKATKAIKSLLGNQYGQVWYSILYFKNEPRGFFTVFKIGNGQYKIGSCNSDDRAVILDELFKTYSFNEIIIFQLPGYYDFFYHIKTYNSHNLSKIDSKTSSEKIANKILKKDQTKSRIDFGPISNGEETINEIQNTINLLSK